MQFFPIENWSKLHLQLIYFGREYCSAISHTTGDCPMCCWVRSKTASPPTCYEKFTKQKSKKGIVFYSDRIEELKQRKESCFFSSPTNNTHSSGFALAGPPVLSALKKSKKRLNFPIEEVDDNESYDHHRSNVQRKKNPRQQSCRGATTV